MNGQQQKQQGEISEVFRGHFDECLKHLGETLAGQRPKGSKGTVEARIPIRNFCGVNDNAVTGWLNGKRKPLGERRIKMMCLLDINGYRVIEIENLGRDHKGRRYFLEIIGFGLLSMKEGAELLGFVNAPALSQILQGHEGTTKEKDQRMWDAWKARKDDLECAKDRALNVFRLDIRSRIAPRPGAPKLVRESPKIVPGPQTATVNIMEGLVGLLEEGSFSKLSESEFAILGPRAVETILRLSAHLNTLSSRLITSREQRGE